MANDRLNIYCRHCQEGHAFIKYYPTVAAGGGGLGGPRAVILDTEQMADSFDKFIEKHIHCAEVANKTTISLRGDPVFEIRAESAERLKMSS